MAYWLLKTEPGEYSLADLVAEGTGVWDGVGNATALIHLRAMKPGDELCIYHTANEKAIIGTAEVASMPYPDPQLDDPRRVVIKVKGAKLLGRAIRLVEIKEDAAFAGWELIRIPRLSVMPVPPTMWKRIQVLSRKGQR